MFLKLLHEDFMSLILKDKSLFVRGQHRASQYECHLTRR